MHDSRTMPVMPVAASGNLKTTWQCVARARALRSDFHPASPSHSAYQCHGGLSASGAGPGSTQAPGDSTARPSLSLRAESGRRAGLAAHSLSPGRLAL
jgi:hypothetical protein